VNQVDKVDEVDQVHFVHFVHLVHFVHAFVEKSVEKCRHRFLTGHEICLFSTLHRICAGA